MEHDILSHNQSGFRKQHSTTTAATRVINDITEALDKGHYSVSLFIDLSKAFNTVDFSILKTKLKQSGLSNDTISWLESYLVGRTQYSHFPLASVSRCFQRALFSSLTGLAHSFGSICMN